MTISVAPTQPLADGLPAHSSWGTLSWSNGYGSSFYDTQARRLRSMRAHLYANFDGNTPTRELMYDTYFGVRDNGTNAWLTSRPVTEASYDAQRGIARVVQTQGNLQVTQWYFSPMAVDAAAVVAVVEVKNLGPTPLADAALFSLHNLHVGGGADGTIGESISFTGNAYEERGEAGLLLAKGFPTPTAHACTPQNPYLTVDSGGRLSNVASSGVVDDAVSGFEWDLSGLAAGESSTVSLVLAHRADGDRAALEASLATLPSTAAQILSAERAGWDAFLDAARVPAGLSPDEAAVYRQQLTMLRMGQVREPGGGYGQVVASLPPGIWNISWVRDQSYAVFGMVHAGLFEQARAAVEFWWKADASVGAWICCDNQGDPWVGTDYALSVVRYHGNGAEETDFNAQGPNVEFDGFGLALAVTEAYVAATDDETLLTSYGDAIFTRTADVLVSLIEPTGPAAGLIRADSSIWESHWYDGGKRHYTYTQATSVSGLRAAAKLADRVGRTVDAERYRAAADTIAAAIETHLIAADTGILRSSLEEQTSYLDAAAIEAFNWGAIASAHPSLARTLDAFRAGLWNDAVGRGYHRNDDGGEYDRREWAVIDLRIATAARAAGRAEHADGLIAWVTDQARANYDLVPENYDRITGDYQGEVPMIGFGAGAYVTALWERGNPGPPVEADAGVGTDAGTPATDDGGGCCQTSSAPHSGTAAMLALVGAALLGRKRRRRA